MKKFAYILVLFTIFIGKVSYAENVEISNLLKNQVFETNKTYNFDDTLKIIDNSSIFISYKSIINGSEIRHGMSKNDIINVFKSNNANACKILYVDESVVYVDFYKDNYYPVLPPIDNTIQETVKETEKEIVKETIKAAINEEIKEVVKEETTKETVKETIKSETNSYIKNNSQNKKYKIELVIKQFDENGNEIIPEENSEIVASGSDVEYYIKSNKKTNYVDKLFKNDNEKITINYFVNDLNNENYQKIYEDISNGRYEIIFEVFLDNYNNLYSDFSTLFKNDLYTQFFKDINKEFEKSNYKDLFKDLNEIIKKYPEFESDLKNFKEKNTLKVILLDISSGKYKNLIKDVTELLKSNNYRGVIDDLVNEFFNGKYANVFYDFLYNFLDITYKYEKDIIVKVEAYEKKETVKETIETKVQETIASESIIEETHEEIEKEVKPVSLSNIILKIVFITVLVVLCGVIVLIILNLRKKIKRLDKEEEEAKSLENNDKK